MSDFGHVSLDIKDSMASDSGLISCIATNLAGQAETTGRLKVAPNEAIMSSTLHPAGQIGLENISKADNVKFNLKNEQVDTKDKLMEKPRFLEPLPEKIIVDEGKLLKLETKYLPKDDSTLQINWYHNGMPLKIGSRVKASTDFGKVVLEVSQTSILDCGVYTCKAVNPEGEAVVFTKVQTSGQSELDLSTQHPKGAEGLKAISEFEAKHNLKDTEEQQEVEGKAPVFVKKFTESNSFEEDSNAYFEAILEPKGDDKMVIEWTKDGKPLQESTRLKTVHSFGLVILELNKLSSRDEGRYVCKAQNQFGNTTAFFDIKIESKQIDNLVPKFTSNLENKLDLNDGDSVHLQCNYTPKNDPDLRIEWALNGQALPTSSRTKAVADFGIVTLDISGVDSRDSGTYSCRAYNS